MFAAPLSSMVTYHTLALSESDVQHAEGWNKDIDVPTWRIGDEWVYETKFDVAQLIAQANVSASLNTLTGDTTYTVDDVLCSSLKTEHRSLAYALKVETANSDSSTNNDPDAEPLLMELLAGWISIIQETMLLQVRDRDLGVINSRIHTRCHINVPCIFGFPLSRASSTSDIGNHYFRHQLRSGQRKV